MDITRTMPATECPEWVAKLFDGTRREASFPLAGVPQRAGQGDSLLLIYRGQVVGRFEILEVVPTRQVVAVGPRGGRKIAARCRVVVGCPGERPAVVIRRKGHQGIRYVRVSAWKGARGPRRSGRRS